MAGTLVATGNISNLALEPSTPLARLNRQSWTMDNGLPQNTIPVLAQSHDGFLWAGTELGLVRFDGISFRLFDHASALFPDAEIRCLLDAPGNSLWVGTADGLVHWSNGRTLVYTTHDGLLSGSIRGLAQTSGTIWVWTEAGLARSVTSQSIASQSDIPLRFEPVVEGVPAGTITSLTADTYGNLWLATTAGAAFFSASHWQSALKSTSLKEASGRTYLVAPTVNNGVLLASPDGVFLEDNPQSLAATPAIPKSALPADNISFLARLTDGTIAAASKTTLVLATANGHLATFNAGRQLPGSRIESLYADREGSLWIGTNHGLARIHSAPQQSSYSVELFAASDPLAAASVVSLLEDREGDLWAGTETSGLHILRDAHFRIFGAAEGFSSDATTAIVQDAQGNLWIGTRDAGLNRIDAGSTASTASPRISTLTAANGLSSNIILSLAAAASGDLWVGTPDGLNHVAPSGKITTYTSADGLPDDFIRSLLVATDNSLWIGTRRGLTHLTLERTGLSLKTFTTADGLGSELVGALTLAPNGDLWIATLNGLSRLHDGHLHNYTTTDGLSSNIITALNFTPDNTLWIGTQDAGLNRWDGQHFVHVDAPGLPTAIHAIVHDDVKQQAGVQLWLASNSALTRVPIQSLLRCTSCPVEIQHFTTADGLRSRETSSNSHPTALRTRDGQLWFATPRGAVLADPGHFINSRPAPPVAIERFAIDDTEASTSNGIPLQISAGHLRFEFDYAGLSFASPQKLRYQYKLDGFDHSWTDAGTRRTAYYTNIPSGHYTFRVRATLGDLALPTNPSDPQLSEASLAFELRPHFYQTLWFYLVLALTLAALVFALFRLTVRRRLHRAEREFAAVAGERSRIAREIHDTLAQGYVGISLQLEVLGQFLRLNRTDAAAKHLELTQNFVREGLDDARQSIWALRSQDSAEQTLPVRLRRLVEQAGTDTLTASLEVHGAYRSLDPSVEKELLRIAQEAIHNVHKHASASLLTVRLVYDEHMVGLTVIDNGRGFSTLSPLKEGHFGLAGLRERTALIGGNIQILTQPGAGVTIRVEVPVPDARAASDESKLRKHS